MSSSRPWLLLLIPAVVAVVTELQWRHWISWDEIEFFRASRWIAEGQVPYRDFWEHHVPLQWFLFAPAAALLGDGPGASSVLAMRWAQVPLWIAFFVVLFRLMRHCGLSLEQRWIAVLLLLGSSSFTLSALEFRVDTLGNLLYFCGLLIAVIHPRSTRAWLAFGAVMSLSVLANMRMAPLVLATGALAFVIRTDDRRWRWNGSAGGMIGGIIGVAAVFVGWLVFSGAAGGFIEGMRFNIMTDRLVSQEANTFVSTLLLPLRRVDLTGIMLWLAAFAGLAMALRNMRTPGVLQWIAILTVVSVISIASLGVHYVYHYETAFLLMAPLAASAVTRVSAQKGAILVIGIVLAFNLTRLIQPSMDGPMRYQDAIMRAVHVRTLPHERVFDGVGYALHRPPAYRYWFLPAGVRMLAMRGLIEPYGLREMMAAPPAAIVFSYRVSFWLQAFPDAGAWAMRHYIPMYRDLWVPALSARIEPSGPGVAWVVPRDGLYRLHASELLAKHPWFREPLSRALAVGDAAQVYVIPLQELDTVDLRRVRITIDDLPLASTVVALRKGQTVRLRGAWTVPVGVLLAPADLTELFLAPEERFAL